MALEHDEAHGVIEEAAASISSPRRRYSPVGRCIYCGVPAEEAGPRGLGDEHIIPLSLGGTLELPEASCDRCGGETHAFEGFCAGNMLKAARTLLHWKSRKSKRPKTLKIGLSMEKWIDLDVTDILQLSCYLHLNHQVFWSTRPKNMGL
jgi:HNH endonuclease